MGSSEGLVKDNSRRDGERDPLLPVSARDVAPLPQPAAAQFSPYYDPDTLGYISDLRLPMGDDGASQPWKWWQVVLLMIGFGINVFFSFLAMIPAAIQAVEVGADVKEFTQVPSASWPHVLYGGFDLSQAASSNFLITFYYNYQSFMAAYRIFRYGNSKLRAIYVACLLLAALAAIPIAGLVIDSYAQFFVLWILSQVVLSVLNIINTRSIGLLNTILGLREGGMNVLRRLRTIDGIKWILPRAFLALLPIIFTFPTFFALGMLGLRYLTQQLMSFVFRMELNFPDMALELPLEWGNGSLLMHVAMVFFDTLSSGTNVNFWSGHYWGMPDAIWASLAKWCDYCWNIDGTTSTVVKRNAVFIGLLLTAAAITLPFSGSTFQNTARNHVQGFIEQGDGVEYDLLSIPAEIYVWMTLVLTSVINFKIIWAGLILPNLDSIVTAPGKVKSVVHSAVQSGVARVWATRHNSQGYGDVDNLADIISMVSDSDNQEHDEKFTR